MAEVLDLKTKELVGIAAAVAGHCQPCFTYHLGEARAAGATLEEIGAAVEMARAVRSAGNRQMDEFVARRMAGAVSGGSSKEGSDVGA
jgi:AhpD family alkylhydroperoxidase